MSERTDALKELARRRAKGEMDAEQAAAFDELRSRGAFKDIEPSQTKPAAPDVSSQQEIIDRMSKEVPEILGQDIPNGTGETLGQLATRPDVLRTGAEIGGMFLGGATAPLLVGRAATKIPALLEFINRSRQAAPILTNVGMRGAGAAAGGGLGSLAVEPVAPSGDPLGRAGETALFGLAGEGLTGGLTKIADIVRPTLRQGADVAQKVLQKYGGTLTSGEATVPGVMGQLAEGVARSGVTGRQTFKKLTEINESAVQSVKNELLDTISTVRPGDVRTGKLFQQSIEKGEKAHSQTASKMYEFLDKEAGVVVDMSGVKNNFIQLSKRLEKLGNVGKTERGGKLIDQLSNVNKNLSFKEAHELRSSLLSTARDLRASGQETIALRNVTQALKMVEDSMEQAAKKSGGTIYSQYKEANAFYKKGKQAFSNEVIEKLVSSNPERVGEYLFRSGNVTEIVQAKASLRQAQRMDRSVDAGDVFQKMKAGFLDAKLTGKGMTNVESDVIAKNFLKELAEKKTDRTISAMFSRAEQAKIREFATTAMRVSAKKGETSELGVIVPIVQATALVDMVTFQFNNPTMDAAVIITPFVMSKMVTNPRLVNKLIVAMKTPPSSKRGAALAAELALEIDRLSKDQENSK